MKLPAHTARLHLLLVAAMAAPAIGLILAAGCRPGRGTRQPAMRMPAPGSTQFAGSAACAQCHTEEFKRHHASNHAKTLRRAEIREMGSLAPPVGIISGTIYRIARRDGGLYFERNDEPASSEPIEFVLGSGKTAITYIGNLETDRLTEFRMSYAPSTRTWFTTPGQVDSSDLALGTVFELGMATRCILCHADRLASGSTKPAEGYTGVGCESCHGAGRPHIEAVLNSRGSDIKMEKMSTWGADRIDALCARCHRSADDVSLDQCDASTTARFQPYGLELSPCFKKSQNKLSCITCHDAHTDAATDRHTYEKVCLSCHSTASAAHSKVCPVNPRDRCVACHMPKRAIFAGSKVPLAIADHFIWAYRPQRH